MISTGQTQGRTQPALRKQLWGRVGGELHLIIVHEFAGRQQPIFVLFRDGHETWAEAAT